MKKTINKLFILSLIFFFVSCATIENYPSEISLDRKNNSSSYTLSGNGYSKTSENAIKEAEKNIFNVLLFQGIAGTDLEIPMIENESQAKSKNAKYFSSLIDNGGYRKFITNRNNGSPSITKGGYKAQISITINYGALKKDLEQNNVIRKFGF
tara:strand:+ start:783 stop:1241 length:459 start_codon:yes stop_codon:yes gene_type:complete